MYVNQEIVYQARSTLKTIRKGFGDAATEEMLAITEVLRDYMTNTYKDVVYYYRVYYVAEDSGYIGRKLSNLIRGCPEYYPVVDYLNKVNWTGGFRKRPLRGHASTIVKHMSQGVPLQYPTNPLSQFDVQSIRQMILGAQPLPTEICADVFGKPAVQVAKQIDQLLDEVGANGTSDNRFTKHFEPYIVEQYDVDLPVYRGLIYSNLFIGCPVFYPRRPYTFAANQTGGYLPIKLPDSLRSKIKEVTTQNN